jgi:hypothetical protein
MEVITIESTAFNEILRRLEDIATHLNKLSKGQSLDEVWLDDEEFCDVLKISKKTSWRYRENGSISYSQIGNKIYYHALDIEAFLMSHYIKSPRTKRREE